MNRKWLFAVFLLLSLAGIALAQNPSPDSIFVPVRQIGRLRPSGIQYDPNFDRFVMVDLQGRLLLADAATLQTQHILYDQGAYNAYQFSHDGRYLALAIDRRVELWDTQTGTKSATFEPDGANLVQGPFFFTPDDHYMLLSSVVAAPQATRRSENDTSIIPYLWDLRAARSEATTTLPNFLEGYPFFNFRNGLVIGPNNFLIAGIPSRLQVIDGRSRDYPVVAEIPSSRLERDPIYVWRSLTDDYLYVDPRQGSDIVQVDTHAGTTFDIPLERGLDYPDIKALQGLGISNLARIIGQPNSQRENSFVSLLLDQGYGTSLYDQPTTVMLLDILQPMTMTADQMGLLVYIFNPQAGQGQLELIHPTDVQQMVLNPDHTRLMVRRASGLQPIEVYNLDTGVLEKSYYPTQPDNDGSHILAYNASGSVIVSDFQRLDAATGVVLMEDPNYTAGFDSYSFTQDNRALITITGADWQKWDVATGQVLQQAKIYLRGQVIDQSPDGSRYLTEFETNDGTTMEIVDVGADARQNFTIPNLPGHSVEQILPSGDWQNDLVVYAANPETEHYPGNEIAVYNFQRGQILFLAGDDLPQPEGRQYGWLDNQTIYITSSNVSSQTQPERVYGINYDSSGLPACLVQAYPDHWQDLLPIWELMTLRLRADDLGRMAERLCASTPATVPDLEAGLTPTAPYAYYSNVAPAPIAIPGVPVCLTSRFQGEAIDYAALWRQMTTGLTDEQIQNLETMLCEGLITSVNQIAPTATINPNVYSPPTPTPVAAAPETTNRGQDQALAVMAINIETGERSTGSYIPPHGRPARDIAIIVNLFKTMQHFSPTNPVLSPDGALLAAADPNGFVVIYHLTRSYDQLMADEADAAATRQADAPRSLGLLPSPTPSFEYAGQGHPTLTPTISPTPPPEPQSTLASLTGQDKDICPAPNLSTIDAPPPGYSATGRLFVPPVDNPRVTWVLEPENGHLYPDDRLPLCGLNGNCSFSFDRQWILRADVSLVVSHPDGSQPTVLYTPDEKPVWPQNITWEGEHTLTFSYQGYLPDHRDRLTLLRSFDPTAGTLSDPTLPPAQVQVYDLPTSLVSAQPDDGPLALVSTPYGGNGAKYYLFDRTTGQADYFARTDSGALEFGWHPLGNFFYYRLPNDPMWYVFDTRTRQFGALGNDLPAQNGVWSPDGRYAANWFDLPQDEASQRIASGQRLPRLAIWDSETNQTRRYCIPESGSASLSGASLVWSPDGRYLAFTIPLQASGDDYLTPTPLPDTPVPPPTDIPLETQFNYRSQRTLVLDSQTGYVTIVSTEVNAAPILWTDGGGQ